MLSPTIQIYKVFSESWIWTLSSISVVEGMLLGDERKMCFIWKMHKKPQVSKQHVLPYDLLTCPSTSYPEWDLPSSGSISSRCCPKSPQKLKQHKLINLKKCYSPDLKAVLRNLVCVCVCVCVGGGGWLSPFSPVRLFVTPWTVAHQAPLSMGILQARVLEWGAMPSSRASSQPGGWTLISYVSHIGRWALYH